MIYGISINHFFSFDFIIKPRLRKVSGSPSLIKSQIMTITRNMSFKVRLCMENVLVTLTMPVLKLYVIYLVEHKINLAFSFWGKMSHCDVFAFVHYE